MSWRAMGSGAGGGTAAPGTQGHVTRDDISFVQRVQVVDQVLQRK